MQDAGAVRLTPEQERRFLRRATKPIVGLGLTALLTGSLEFAYSAINVIRDNDYTLRQNSGVGALTIGATSMIVGAIIDIKNRRDAIPKQLVMGFDKGPKGSFTSLLVE